ncbi:MAG: sigma 54-interacting transcriptional regulator [Candidatus Binatia bacterium]
MLTRGADLAEGSGPSHATDSARANGKRSRGAANGSEPLTEADQRFEQVLLQLSTTFVSTPANQIDTQIGRALRQVVEFLGLDGGMLSRVNADTTERWITHSWAAPGLDPPPQVLTEAFPWGSKKILAGEIVAVSRLEELPDEAAVDRESARRLGIQSHVSIPLVVGQTAVGMLSFGSMRCAYAWPDRLIERLQLLAQVFFNALARQQSEVETERQLRFEHLLFELSSKFINLSPTDVDGEIIEALRKTVELLELDRGNFMQLSDDGRLVVTHAAGAHGIPPFAVGSDLADCPWLHGTLMHGQVLRQPRLPEDLPAEAAPERRLLLREGTKSLIAVPLVVAGSVVGALTLGALRCARDWPDALVEQIQLLAQVFANGLARKQADFSLQHAFSEIQQLRERIQAENAYLRQEIEVVHGYEEIIGNSDAIRHALSQAEQVAPMNSTVLILGETGTGKGLLARALHRRSGRKDRVMVKVNCAALPVTLVESELFGREKGAYTGALSKQVGRFELADSSTLFLDEIGALPLELQAKLLHVLQDGQFERLGSTRTIKVDVRVIAATNCDLAAAVREGRFRQDLYYRLNVFPIVVPPLRERRDDIPLLVWTFVKEFGAGMGKSIETIPRKTMESLQAHPWPGNVRELRNVIERAMILTTGPALHVELAGSEAPLSDPGSSTLEEVDRRHILSVLARTNWRVRGKDGAAEILGLKPTTLGSRMHKIGIRRPSSNS